MEQLLAEEKWRPCQPGDSTVSWFGCPISAAIEYGQYKEDRD